MTALPLGIVRGAYMPAQQWLLVHRYRITAVLESHPAVPKRLRSAGATPAIEPPAHSTPWPFKRLFVEGSGRRLAGLADAIACNVHDGDTVAIEGSTHTTASNKP